VISINATAWSALLSSTEHHARRWQEDLWPMGAPGAAVLVAGEAFKCAMHRLRPYARAPQFFDLLFAQNDRVHVELAPSHTRQVADLGRFDLISGGAISHSLLYYLCRLPGVRGEGRIIDPDVFDISNGNRYMLMSLMDHSRTRPQCGGPRPNRHRGVKSLGTRRAPSRGRAQDDRPLSTNGPTLRRLDPNGADNVEAIALEELVEFEKCIDHHSKLS
jgi:hypothetical protein